MMVEEVSEGTAPQKVFCWRLNRSLAICEIRHEGRSLTRRKQCVSG